MNVDNNASTRVISNSNDNNDINESGTEEGSYDSLELDIHTSEEGSYDDTFTEPHTTVLTLVGGHYMNEVFKPSLSVIYSEGNTPEPSDHGGAFVIPSPDVSNHLCGSSRRGNIWLNRHRYAGYMSMHREIDNVDSD